MGQRARWLARAAELGFSQQTRIDYLSEAVYRDFDTWADSLVSVDPSRAELLDEYRPSVRERFYARTRPHPDGHAVERMNHLEVLTAV